MQYLAIKWEKNPLLKINCVKCGKRIESGAIICGDNKQRSPSIFLCSDCVSKNVMEIVRDKLNDPSARIKYLI